MILDQIRHIVVVMLENRSFDNLCGWLYSDGAQPSLVIPAGSAKTFNGLCKDFSNPNNPNYFSGAAGVLVPVVQGTTKSTVPDPDPQETFVNVTQQIYGPAGSDPDPRRVMQGFLLDYMRVPGVTDANQIMQAYLPAQVPVLSQLARSYAISDAWFASVPSQTWPNRAFLHTGTSNGHVDNGEPADPLQWDVQTIFNVLGALPLNWGVYSDTLITPSLTRTMFPRLWDLGLDGHFHNFQTFEDDCSANTLPAYAFLEPSFLVAPNDAHPPHDVEAAEQLLFRIWKAISTSPGWTETLLIITFDEHGGCFDHVLPPAGATPPDAASSPGDQGFGFDRFGIRVPTVLVSPYIQAGTVFRSTTAVPYDHTSILATLRDWLRIPTGAMLGSARIRNAPTFESVLTCASPRTDLPDIAPLNTQTTLVSNSAEPNDLQRSLVTATARRKNLDAAQAADSVHSRQSAIDFFVRNPMPRDH
jgi:phospholipase C